MSNTIKLILIPLCALLVVISFVIMSVFHKLIRNGDSLSVEQFRRTKTVATIMLSIVVIMLAVITVYLVLMLKGRMR
jgi:hypothetical protein